MAKKYYSTKIVGVGGEVPRFIDVAKMMVIFDDSMVFPELREFSVLHSGNHLDGEIKPGDILKIVDSEFKIIKIGNDVQNNLKNLGHIVIKFDGGAGDLLEGSVHVEEKPVPKIQIGDEISILEGTYLRGKRAAVVGNGELEKKLCQILIDNGADIVGEGDDPEIVVKIK